MSVITRLSRKLTGGVDVPGLSIFESRKLSGSRVAPVVLVSLDGFGIAPDSDGNAIAKAKKPNMDKLKMEYLYTELIASGESVGLPANEVGNSEVGHLTMGAGRVIPQYLKRIGGEIKDGSFFDNRALNSVVAQTKQNGKKLHVMGLVGEGNVHSSVEHLYAILELCRKLRFDNVFLHLFTDGRDAPPTSGLAVIEKLVASMNETKVGKVATVCGRSFGMDRDRRWDRTEKAYKAMVLGEGKQATDVVTAIKQSYADAKTDEFIEPTVMVKDGRPVATIDDGDGVIFFNFRADRAIQMTMAMTMPGFEQLTSFKFGHQPSAAKNVDEENFGKTFPRVKIPRVVFVSMTQYHKELPVSGVAYPPEVIKMSLGEVMAQKGVAQLRLSESEKEKMVTYYFDGLREIPFDGEEIIIERSPRVPTYDRKPEMAAIELLQRLKGKLLEDKYGFIMMNLANPDMVAHSGKMLETIEAIEIVDRVVGVIVEMVNAANGLLLVTADHGNAEELLSYESKGFFFTSGEGKTNTDHSNNPVPLYVISKRLPKSKYSLKRGALSDVAPTILAILGWEVPPVMTGKSLLQNTPTS